MVTPMILRSYTQHKVVFKFHNHVLSFFQGEDLGEVSDKKCETHFG